jgi:hypothetical protein
VHEPRLAILRRQVAAIPRRHRSPARWQQIEARLRELAGPAADLPQLRSTEAFEIARNLAYLAFIASPRRAMEVAA